MKKRSVLALSLATVVASGSIAFAGASGIKVQVDGKQITLSKDAKMENDRVFVPVRDIAEALGGQVTWDNNSNTVHINKYENGKKKPKNVIFMVGDGMGIGQIEVARLLEKGKDGRLFMQSLPNVGLVQTYSANNIVTDSGAAGTALATAHKTNNESIGVDANGQEVDSILDRFKQDGKKVGVISTNTATDATPAAFTASVANRWTGQEEVARQMLTHQYDVILGGGKSYFGPKKQNGRDLIQEFQTKGYAYASNKQELANANSDKLLGLFHDSYMNYKTDRDELNSQEPSLMEMTDKALQVLTKNNNKGFFLMVEGARIDHAAHAADITGVWQETVEFDKTVEQVVNWAKNDGETLVIVLADHETMGISATEPMKIDALKNVSASPEYMASKMVLDQATGSYTVDSVKAAFKTYANIELTTEEVDKFNKSVKDNTGKVYPAHKVGWEIGSIVAAKNYVGVVSSEIRALSGTGGHTGNMVPVFSFGPGSESFEGVLDNTDIPEIIANIINYASLK